MKIYIPSKTSIFKLLSICIIFLSSPGALLANKNGDSLKNGKQLETDVTNDIKYGKYGCTASKYTNGAYEFIPRGFLTITRDGKYTYAGFEKPSTGTFVTDKQGNLLFKGGYLNGGKAEKIDRPNKFFLVFPANLDNRWTCTLIN